MGKHAPTPPKKARAFGTRPPIFPEVSATDSNNDIKSQSAAYAVMDDTSLKSHGTHKTHKERKHVLLYEGPSLERSVHSILSFSGCHFLKSVRRQTLTCSTMNWAFFTRVSSVRILNSHGGIIDSQEKRKKITL